MSLTILFFACVPALIFLGAAYWNFTILRWFSPLTVVAFALGVALIGLSAVMVATYEIQMARLLRDTLWILAIPSLIYFVLIVFVGQWNKVLSKRLVLGTFIGFVPLLFFSFCACLMVACSYGDCL